MNPDFSDRLTLPHSKAEIVDKGSARRTRVSLTWRLFFFWHLLLASRILSIWVDFLQCSDPLSSPTPSTQLQVPDRTSQLSPTQQTHDHAQIGRSAASSPVLGDHRAKDFSFLLRPEIYHPLTALNVPLPFRNSSKQPGPETPLEDLLAGGHFRAAAVAAAQELTGSGSRTAEPPVDPHDHARIFRLLYTRLACLTLVDGTALASQEVKALEDLNNPRMYVDEATGEHLAPWELRVLNVRLQALGLGDTRRAVMSYHDLAREARERVRRAATNHDNSARELWRERLHELGIRVAGALIEMDDLTGAAAHLKSLKDKGPSNSNSSKLAISKSLLWLQLGDVESARECAARHTDEEEETTGQVILALCDMADSEYAAALDKWQDLREVVEDEMVGVNAAVCLLYLGKLQEVCPSTLFLIRFYLFLVEDDLLTILTIDIQGRGILESLVESGHSSHTLLFNLSTMYELCTEKHRNDKLSLAERVAAMEVSPKGWEKTTADFKL